MDVDLTRFELLRNAIDALKANAPVASVVIAVLAFLVSLATYRRAWRWRSEAEPAFVQVQGDMLLFPEFKRADGDPVFIGWLANCGDGRALNVKAIGINCDAEVWDCRQIGETVLGKQSEWVMNDCGRLPELTGETMRFFITIAPPQNPRPDQSSDLTKLELGVHWVSSPTRLHRCRYTQFPIWGIEPMKCGPFERLRRWHRDRLGHRRFHALDRKRASEQRRLLS